jgi:hypothetical protein
MADEGPRELPDFADEEHEVPHLSEVCLGAP